MSKKVAEAISLLSQIEEDYTVPKSIREKISGTIRLLKEKNKIVAIRANRAVEDLEAISADTNMPAYTRTQIWNIVSLLESKT